MKEGRVVKGINFVNLKDAGDPVENAVFYEKEGADELAMLDIAATGENRKTRLQWVRMGHRPAMIWNLQRPSRAPWMCR